MFIIAPKLTTEEQAVAAFEREIETHGFSTGLSTTFSMRDAADLDYIMLNEYWSCWIDSMIKDDLAPPEAVEWDWE